MMKASLPARQGQPAPLSAASIPDRFHALDATRAFALLLGVVFHAAWSFQPSTSAGVYAAPVVDAQSNNAIGWFFNTSHSFRMQLFFLIAGFFARLVYQKRGGMGFVRHRVARIVLPLVLGWFMLYPLVMSAWMWGANVSGRNLVEVPIPLLLLLLVAKGLMFVPAAQGGFFSLTHLWFLYYLLWLYALVLSARVMLVALPAPHHLRQAADRGAAWIATSPWSLALLTVTTGTILWRMEGWHGVDTPVNTLVPSGPVLVIYGAFFLLGWLFHRQTMLLRVFARRWKWQLAAGLVLSVLCHGIHHELSASGYINGSFRGRYPNLSPDQIANWPKFAGLLVGPHDIAGTGVELAHFWQRLPEPARQEILRLPPVPTPNQKAGVCDAINKIMANEGVFSAPGVVGGAAPTASQWERVRVRNRARLEVLLDGTIIPNPLTRPSYQRYKFGYSVAYALMMWLLVFGTLGLFQAACPGHSAAWRYVADSAYWIYLVHLPLVAALQVGMSTWQWPALLKFPLLVGIAFVVLFASYHYLVRSTFIGKLLNGQRQPFTPWPFSGAFAISPADTAKPEISAIK